MSKPRWLPVSFVSFMFAACAIQPIEHSSIADLLKDGITRHEEVQSRLGEPSAKYDGSRIVAYRLRKDGGSYAVVRQLSDAHYSLILVFDGDGVLTRHSAVEIRSP